MQAQIDTVTPIFDVQQSLGELVVAVPEAVDVLRGHGLDFCCGGQQSVTAACAEAQLDPADLLAEIAAKIRGKTEPTRWDQRPASELIDHILTQYHEPLRRQLPSAIGLARRVEDVHREHALSPRGLADLLEQVFKEVTLHLATEEQILFPMVLAGHGPKAGNYVLDLNAEHEELGAHLARIRDLTRGFRVPDDACVTWITLYMGLERLEKDLMKHVHLENNILFPQLLDA